VIIRLISSSFSGSGGEGPRNIEKLGGALSSSEASLPLEVEYLGRLRDDSDGFWELTAEEVERDLRRCSAARFSKMASSFF
jgi:hypothetical protein